VSEHQLDLKLMSVSSTSWHFAKGLKRQNPYGGTREPHCIRRSDLVPGCFPETVQGPYLRRPDKWLNVS